MGRSSKQRAALKAKRREKNGSDFSSDHHAVDNAQVLILETGVPTTAQSLIREIEKGIKMAEVQDRAFFGLYSGKDGKGYPQDIIRQVDSYFADKEFSVEVNLCIQPKGAHYPSKLK